MVCNTAVLLSSERSTEKFDVGCGGGGGGTYSRLAFMRSRAAAIALAWLAGA